MAMIDPEQERRRLEEFYAGQMDGELEKVAREAHDLTDLAREVLRAELTKRGLTPKFVEQRLVIVKPVAAKKEPAPQPGDPPPPASPEEESSSGDGEAEFRNRVVIRQFRDLPEALLAKGSLDSAGIESALVDDNVVRLDWFWSNAVGGVKLMVDREEAAEAEEVLAQPIPEDFDVAEVGRFEQPRCPQCGSLDVNFREIDPAAYLTTVVSFPLPIHRRAWRCHACDAQWEDDDVPGSPAPSA
jgi:hypothetical protein